MSAAFVAPASATGPGTAGTPAAGSALAASHDAPEHDAALEARVAILTTELRCPVCRNESVADSTVPLAADLRREVRERLRRGERETAVVAALRERYGDALLYRPPLTAGTALLWAAPGLLLAAGALALGAALRAGPRHPRLRRPQRD